MSKTLLLVESPTKAKKLQSYLGSDYVVQATFGHIMDLPPKELGIDLETMEETYEVLTSKGTLDYNQLLKKITLLAKEAKHVLIASDPDREGEAIGWHIQRYLKLKDINYDRIELHEITKAGVEKALLKKRKIDTHWVAAQRARRVLDRLMGYGISPVLMKAVDNARSAGRVQSSALRMIVERDREHERFKPEDRHSIAAKFTQHGIDYKGQLLETQSVYDYANPSHDEDEKESNKKKKKFVSDTSLASLVQAIREIPDSEWSVISVDEKSSTVNPKPPLITSTLQQLGARRLGFSGDLTMAIAQKLFENGYITYMRTDSTRIAEEAQEAARKYLRTEYGADMVPDTPNVFKNGDAAQDAHEAIRPTDINTLSNNVQIDDDKNVNQIDARMLYDAIREVFLCSQAAPGKNSITNVITEDTDAKFQFETSSVVWSFAGWRAISKDEPKPDLATTLKKGHSQLNSVEEQKTQTKPKPRFKEESLTDALEKNKVGRPSSYANIVKTLIQRGYVSVQKNREIVSSELGRNATDWLVNRAAHYTDIKYTALMEDRLDRISQGKENRLDIMSETRDDLKQHFNAFQERGSGSPSFKQKELLDSIKARGENVPDQAYATIKDAKEFLDKYMASRLPSEKQVDFALNLSKSTGKEYTEAMRLSAVQTKKFIDETLEYAQKNNIRTGGGSDKPATPKQIEMAKKLASERNIAWDSSLEQSMSKISTFIDAQMAQRPKQGNLPDKPATPKQIAMAQSLAQRLGVDYPESYQQSMQKTSAFIDKHMKK